MYKAEEFSKGLVTGGTLFEELGFYYLGPIDGHDVNNLVTILENVKNSNHQGPILIHAITKKGKGYKPAEESGDKYHGFSKFNVTIIPNNDPIKLPATPIKDPIIIEIEIVITVLLFFIIF